MKNIIKYVLLFAGVVIAAIYIFYLVTFLSPSTDLFAPMK